MKMPDSHFDPSTIDDYIQQTVKQAFQPSASNTFEEDIELEDNFHVTNQPTLFPYELIELHQYFIVKIQVPRDVTPGDIRITLGNCKLHVEHIEDGVTEKIPLPEQPTKKHMSAQYKNGIIEVRLLKKSNDYNTEIYIQY